MVHFHLSNTYLTYSIEYKTNLSYIRILNITQNDIKILLVKLKGFGKEHLYYFPYFLQTSLLKKLNKSLRNFFPNIM